ncbi:hypothetical protein KKD81_00445 [Patescibacteria group bacterium]|nr:hypothetical protein [Patescibacteria group bacterium]
MLSLSEHMLALVELQVSSDASPLTILAGFAVSVAVGVLPTTSAEQIATAVPVVEPEVASHTYSCPVTWYLSFAYCEGQVFSDPVLISYCV